MRSKYITGIVLIAAVAVGALLLSNIGISNTSLEWMQISDPAHLYSIKIPSDWRVNSENSAVYDSSFVEANSPDWLAETTDELFDKTHIVRGAAIEIYTTTQDTGFAPSHIPMAHKLLRSEQITVNNIKGEFTTYREYNPPEHEEGLISEAKIHFLENYFTFRIAYNPTTYPQGKDVFMRMLQSITLAGNA